ncbi:MAG: WecB/TagA/CpsF family glycosyltransferase [Candidatus Moranbacteria bacterium]|nr:WecB/TagA/CpsF family glycosyltransferase [Candidatus Moranbacteria bacterium]
MKSDITIFGVRIDNFSVREIKEKISNFLENSPRQKFVATLNPEILLKAHRNEKYRNILNSADLNICDGFGLKLVSFLKGNKIRARFSGADLVDFLLELAEDKKHGILVVSAQNSLSLPKEIEQAIKRKHPNLSAKSEYFLPSQEFFKNGIINQAEIVFVNFGAPEQEKFIFENRAKFPNAKILIGVGGAFDFLTGKIRRAPRFFRVLGLEWSWRLAQEPKRFRRIWNAVVVFPVISLSEKKS